MLKLVVIISLMLLHEFVLLRYISCLFLVIKTRANPTRTWHGCDNERFFSKCAASQGRSQNWCTARAEEVNTYLELKLAS
jgi:hypothetical protein